MRRAPTDPSSLSARSLALTWAGAEPNDCARKPIGYLARGLHEDGMSRSTIAAAARNGADGAIPHAVATSTFDAVIPRQTSWDRGIDARDAARPVAEAPDVAIRCLVMSSHGLPSRPAQGVVGRPSRR